MDDKNNLQIILKEALQFCRGAVNELNENSLVSLLRNQNEQFDKALDVIEGILPKAENVLSQNVKDVGIRAATMFIIGLWSKLKDGVSVDDLTKDDWKNVMGVVYEKAAELDPKEYSLLVFDLYRKSIAYAIEPMRLNASSTVIHRLEEIVNLMEGFANGLKSGDITETKFIEENLWLSLEAVFLVLTDRISFRRLPEERRELAEAVSALVFQIFRYDNYDKELAAVNECLEYQGKLDQKLTNRVNEYIGALRDELDEFDMMVEKAFSTADFTTAFRGSIDLAGTLGAEGILQTRKDIDKYFMS